MGKKEKVIKSRNGRRRNMGQMSVHRDPLCNHHSSQNFLRVHSLFCQESSEKVSVSKEIKNSSSDFSLHYLHVSRMFCFLQASNDQHRIFIYRKQSERLSSDS